MLKNYLKFSLRHIRRNKIYSSINIIGLAIGIAGFFLIMLWVQDELSFDKFHENRDSIYRVVCETKGEPFFGSPAPLAPTIANELPEVLRSTRLYRVPRFVFGYEEKSFYEDNGIVVDPAFFHMFSFPFIKGSLETGFTNPDHIVITESMAQKYFGADDPINKKINVEGEGFLVVGGVLKDIPANSHLQFDYALPYVFLQDVRLCGLEWGDFNFKTYVQLNLPLNQEDVQKKITQIAIDNDCPQIKYDGFSFSLQSLKDMYLHPISAYDIQLGDMKYIYIFSIVALLLLGVACINFINLSTARAIVRVKEVSIRKTVGADRRHIIAQLWSEFFVFALSASVIALAIVQVAMPYFNQLTEKQLALHFMQPHMLILMISAICCCGLVAGLYPAISISVFQPVRLMQRQTMGLNSPFLRRLLVVSQFALSILLIVCTLVVAQQMRYIHDKSWTLRDDVVLHMPIKENIGIKFDVVKNELLLHPNIVAVSAKDALPTMLNNNTTGVWWTGKTDAQNSLHIETIRVSHDYFTTMGLALTEGRAFSQDFSDDEGVAYILNEEAVRQTGLSDPVGKSFALYRRQGPIIGVVQDSYFHTLKQPKRPQAFYLFTNLPREGFFGSVFIRISKTQSHADVQAVISHIESVWRGVNQIAPFEYHFLDQTIQKQYQDEQRLMFLFGIFSAVAILISCLGLFGLATFMAERRTKEIGIRKALGSTVPGVIMLLTRSFATWVLIANIIAWPLAWFIMNKWLQNFVYRTEMTWWMFVLAGGMAFVIALLTISWQAIRAATANPVEALRYE
ncbi:ABC transporter permease [candidate division KSB1 bacterium]|nr:ABC transporter permease [candidate division KSB1 bacterium]